MRAATAIVMWSAVASAQAPPSQVRAGDDGFDTRSLPAVSADRKTVAVAIVDPDGARGNPNLTVELKREKKQAFSVLRADEYEKLGGGDGKWPARLKELVAKRLAPLNAELVRGFVPMRQLFAGNDMLKRDVSEFSLADAGLTFRLRNGALEISSGRNKVATLRLEEAVCGSQPYIAEIWVEPDPAPSLAAINIKFPHYGAEDGNDQCDPPNAWKVARWAPGAPTGVGTVSAPAIDRAAARAANERGMKRYAALQWAEAAVEFRAATAADPGYVKAHYNLACVASLFRDKATARAELRWLRVSADPDAKAHLVKGRTDPDLTFAREDEEVKRLLAP